MKQGDGLQRALNSIATSQHSWLWNAKAAKLQKQSLDLLHSMTEDSERLVVHEVALRTVSCLSGGANFL